MKKIYRIAALLSVVTFAVSGCVEENLEPVKPNKPANNGDEILFGARAGFENSDPDTKTAYSGATYDVEGKKYERIDWVANDKIEIYCPQAINGPTSHYSVVESNNENGKNSFASLLRVGASSLQWGDDVEHHFYAMYPSTDMFSDDAAEGIFMNVGNGKVEINGLIPTKQNPIEIVSQKDEENNLNHYVAKPDMRFAYMVAKSAAERTQESVSLSFIPLVTAVEIELKNVTDAIVSVGTIEISSETPIAGAFTADLMNWTSTYPNCVTTGTDKSITVKTRLKQASGNEYPVPLMKNETLKFTVFMLPAANSEGAENAGIADLSVSVSLYGDSYKTKKLSNASIPYKMKTRISNLHLPELKAVGDNWMEDLPGNILFKELSLPGAGGAFTSAGPEGFRQQTLNFAQLWTLGIRAFEVVSDKPDNDTGAGSLSGQKVLCNKKEVTDNWWGGNVTVGGVLTELLNKVKGSKETAVLIMVYQPTGTNYRNPVYYAQALKAMLKNDFKDRLENIIPYKPGLTLNDVRGKVILICRPTQRHEDIEDDIFESVKSALIDEDYNYNQEVTLIDGCGSAKDRWGARGYQVADKKVNWSRTSIRSWGSYSWGSKATESPEYENFKPAVDISNYFSASEQELGLDPPGEPTGRNQTQTGYDLTSVPYMEYYMENNEIAGWKNTGMNFAYKTNFDFQCWYQEWARVFESDRPGTSYYIGWTRHSINWFASLQEKKNNITDTFDMAVSGQHSNYVFINSLCGYLAESNENGMNSLQPSLGEGIGTSIWGGAGGNIKGLATILNQYFYEYLLSSEYLSKPGPTGIIMMDFLSADPLSGAAYHLPGAITNNNLKYVNK